MYIYIKLNHFSVHLKLTQHKSTLLHFTSILKKAYRDFPGGTMVKTPRSQCRGPRFDPWSGN